MMCAPCREGQSQLSLPDFEMNVYKKEEKNER